MTSNNMTHQNILSNKLDRWITYGIWIMIVLIYIPVPAIPGTLIAFMLFILSLYSMNNETRGLALMCFAAPVLGALFFVLHVHLTAYFICLFLGLIFLRNYIKSNLGVNKELIPFGLLIIIFLISYLYGPQHSYSNSKLIYIISIGICSIIYWNVYLQSPKLQLLALAQFLCLISLLYVYIAFDFYPFKHPMHIFDLNFFRGSFSLIRKSTATVLTYHSVGIPAMMGLALIFSSFKLSELRRKKIIIVMLPLIILLLIAQARQAIFGTFIILFIRLIIDTSISFNRKIGFSVILAFTSLFIITNLRSDYMESAMNATTFSKSLNRNYDDAFKILETDFILGKGLGGFSTNGVRAYPHNLFLELLCELGMVGTLLIIVLIFVPLLVKPNRFQLMTKSNFYALPLIVAIFIRSMMSSDLIDSITLITAIIVISNTQTNKLCQQSLSI